MKKLFLILGFTMMLSAVLTPSLPVYAATPSPTDADYCSSLGGDVVAKCSTCLGSSGTWNEGEKKCEENTANSPKVTDTVKNIVNLLLFVAGMAAVIVLTVSGLRFVMSNGEPQQVTSARNGITYSLIGLTIAVSAYAIVNFILDRI